MIQTEKNKRKTDQAWNKLYNRLEKEGLLPAPAQNTVRFPVSYRWFTLGAALIGCLLYFAFSFLHRDDAPETRTLLTELNKEKSTLVTTLEDGSIVYLARNTSLQYPEHFSPEKREVLLQGNALFDVKGNKKRPFIIETEEIRIEVIGTAFDVKNSTAQPFELSVQRGEVKVTLKKNNESKQVKVGETVALLSGNLHLYPTPNTIAFDRYTEQMRFKDEPLGNILHVINLHSPDLQIRTTEELAKRPLTVAFSNNTPEAMAELICHAFELKCTRENNILFLSE